MTIVFPSYKPQKSKKVLVLNNSKTFLEHPMYHPKLLNFMIHYTSRPFIPLLLANLASTLPFTKAPT